MVKPNTSFLKITLGIATILFAGISYLDWSRLFLPFGSDLTEVLLSRVFKLSLSATMFFFAWNIANDSVNKIDTWYMRCVFGGILIADIFFFIKVDIVGMGIFFIIQVLFIIRNSRGMKTFFKTDAHNHIARLASTFVFPLVLFLAIYVTYLWPLMKQETILAASCCAYGILSCYSVWTGFTSGLIKHFPSRNSMLIVAGLSCLYACDVAVGFSLGFSMHQIKDTYYVLSTSFTWLFYAPMLLFMALSTNKFDNNRLS